MSDLRALEVRVENMIRANHQVLVTVRSDSPFLPPSAWEGPYLHEAYEEQHGE